MTPLPEGWRFAGTLEHHSRYSILIERETKP